MLKNIKISNWCMGFRVMCSSINCSCFGVFGRDDNERNAWESLLNLSKFPQVNFICFYLNSQIIVLPVFLWSECAFTSQKVFHQPDYHNMHFWYYLETHFIGRKINKWNINYGNTFHWYKKKLNNMEHQLNKWIIIKCRFGISQKHFIGRKRNETICLLLLKEWLCYDAVSLVYLFIMLTLTTITSPR